MTGIAWNEKLTGPVTSIEQLFEDPKLKGKVSMLMELADSVGLVMLANGDDPAEVTDETCGRAIEGSGRGRLGPGGAVHRQRLRAAADEGELAAAVAWSGDVVQLLADNPKLKWGVPKDGGMIWTDNMFIPTGRRPVDASTYMNYVYEPAVAAKIAAYVNYVPPVRARKRSSRSIRSSRTTR